MPRGGASCGNSKLSAKVVLPALNSLWNCLAKWCYNYYTLLYLMLYYNSWLNLKRSPSSLFIGIICCALLGARATLCLTVMCLHEVGGRVAIWGVPGHSATTWWNCGVKGHPFFTFSPFYIRYFGELLLMAFTRAHTDPPTRPASSTHAARASQVHLWNIVKSSSACHWMYVHVYIHFKSRLWCSRS